MDIHNVIAFNLALAVALISPGPAFVISVQTTLSSGCKSGIWFGVGLGLMAAVWTGLALLGLETIFQIFPWAYGAVRICGAAYLIFLAIKMWLGSNERLEEKPRINQGHSFVRGLLVNALNPKSIFFAAAVLAIVFPPNMLFAENLLVVFNQFVVEVAFYAALANFIGRDKVRASYLKTKKSLDRLSSVVLGSFGLSLVAERYTDS